MAVAKLAKLLIVTHKSDETVVLKALQKRAVAEISPYIIEEKNAVSIRAGTENYKNNRDIKKAIDILDNYKDKVVKKIASKAGKFIIQKSEYEKISKREDFETILKEIFGYEDEIKNNDLKIAELKLRVNQLKIWRPYKGNIKDIKSTDSYTIRLVMIKAKNSEFEQIALNFDENNVSFEVILKKSDI